jgi:hypothetical protein
VLDYPLNKDKDYNIDLTAEVMILTADATVKRAGRWWI